MSETSRPGTVLRWEGTATAVSSVVHGSQALGTVTYLRRERFLMPSGTVEEIPVVSGNALRGILRDTAADLWWERVGQPRLTLPVMHALWSGGALAKVSGPPLTGSRLARLRALCPVVGVFGAAGGGRIINGALQVGKLIPICQETAHLIPERLRADDTADLPSMWDLTQVEYYSKIPGVPGEPSEPEALTLRGGDSEDGEGLAPARYGVETFLAGTRFHCWMTLTWPTPQEVAFFAETLDRFTQEARVGGMARAGHGRLRLDLEQPSGVSADVPWRLPNVEGTTEPTAASTLLEVLAWLD